VQLVKIGDDYFNPEQVSAVVRQNDRRFTLIYTQGYSNIHRVEINIEEVVKLLQGQK